MNNNLTLIWAIILLVAQLIYLLIELAFNARLVDSVMVSSTDYFEHLSFIGRCISGVGFTLFIFSLIKFKPAIHWAKITVTCIVVAVITFPAVFYGQEKLINYFVDISTAEQRKHALYLALLKKGLANNAVVLKGVEYGQEDLDRAEVKTFISNIGFMVFFTPNYIQSVIDNSDAILEHIARQQSDRQIKPAYSAYLFMRSEIEKSMQAYNQANAAYLKELNNVPEQAEGIWKTTYTELQNQWKHYQEENINESLEDKLDMLIDGLERYKLAKLKCRGALKQLCLNSVNSEYNETMKTAFGEEVIPDYWCMTVRGHSREIFQGGRFVRKTTPDRLDCSYTDRAFLLDKMLALTGAGNGLYSNFDEFMASKTVADELRQRLKKDGINMPEKYRLRSHQTFMSGIRSELTRLLNEAFMTQTNEQFGEPIAPLLTSREFANLALVQAPLKKALGLPIDAEHADINLSEREFRDTVLMSAMLKELGKQRKQLLSEVKLFADGEEREQEGKQYVRSILIPPIAMGLSLFFALLNFSTVLAGIAVLLGSSKILIKRLKHVFIITVVLLPVITSDGIARTQTFELIENETREALGIGSYFIVWLSNLQPIIYPFGYAIAEIMEFSPADDVQP